GLIRKSRDVEGPAELLVYPALVPVPDAVIRSEAIESGRRDQYARSRGGEFHGLREFRQGDDPRDIHWRTSARRGRDFVRGFGEEPGRAALVVPDTARRGIDEPAFEAAVSLAASVAVALLKTGLHVGLATADTFLAPAAGPAQGPAILRCLALIQPV